MTENRPTFPGKDFTFRALAISGIDNSAVISRFGRGMSAQETALFHDSVERGDDYPELLHRRLIPAMQSRQALPVVRFADGEYFFYRESLRCNGLYQQAESVAAIRAVLPAHIESLRYVAGTGMLAPLIFPGNFFLPKRSWRSLFRRPSGDDSAAGFLEFLSGNGIALSRSNYLPFYAVYAYLASARFARAVSGKKICILNSDIQRDACARWFDQFSSSPEIVEVPIPASLVATRWPSMEEDVLKRIPGNADACLVGAGVGALPVCASIARSLSIPAIDAGHVLNMMNGLESKSGGPRLYTIYR